LVVVDLIRDVRIGNGHAQREVVLQMTVTLGLNRAKPVVVGNPGGFAAA
jgi:hypothetical protein